MKRVVITLLMLVASAAAQTKPQCSTMFTGFAITPAGQVQGTPTTPGQCQFTVTACDSQPTPSCSQPTVLTITIISPVAITTVAMPNATTNKTYSAPIQAGGGVAPYTFTLSTGAVKAVSK